jgi:hypothetical protein
MGEIRNAFRIFVRRPEGKKPVGRCRCRLEDGNVMILSEIGWEVVNYFHLVQDVAWCQALVSIVMNLWFPERFVVP